MAKFLLRMNLTHEQVRMNRDLLTELSVGVCRFRGVGELCVYASVVCEVYAFVKDIRSGAAVAPADCPEMVFQNWNGAGLQEETVNPSPGSVPEPSTLHAEGEPIRHNPVWGSPSTSAQRDAVLCSSAVRVVAKLAR